MALQKTWAKTINGFTGTLEIENAYCKVGTISGTKLSIDFDVQIKPSVNDDAVDSRYYTFEPNMDSNFIAQAYDYLKTLPEFNGAIDC